MVEAVVEFDYEAQQDDELGLTVGDIIVNIRRDDGGWWEGELGGRRGLFPDNFVREIKKEGKRDGGQASMIRSDLANGRASPVSDPGVRPGRKGEQIRKRRCKAAFSYVPQHEDELELKIGDVIDIITEVEEGWWEGLLHGKTGMFPSNFTRVVVAESDTDTATSQEELRSSRSSKDSPGSESDGGDSRSETGSGEIVPKKVRGFGFGDIFKDQPIKLRPRSMEIDSEGDKVNEGKAASVAPETMKTEPDNKTKGREQCKVLFPYDGQNEDELSIKEGEIVNIITKECADAGWWMGEIGGRQGVFPDNFVKLLEVEKERPRKPPPPSAPSAKNTTDADLDAVLPAAEKLSHPTVTRPRVTDRRPRSQIISASSLSSIDLDPPAVEDRKEKERGKDEPGAVPVRSVDVSLRKGIPPIPAPDGKAPLPAKPSVLTPPNTALRPISPSSSSGLSPSPELRHSPLTPLTVEELRNQLRDLRTSVELLKSQHRQEMKQLSSALDEEKKIRLSLQMEVEHIKKNLMK
ncbi:SH3 domain-containing kinase-binding protein 1 isoform X3 [Hippoglossus hippoglossus]|uniref:SH3 domain-containing kinase-binding protein 1 isoform X3 n=1 Tax=Hippoglossus hippoglossus TaxID=8267 RepID=UPI00148B574A|nr:SH3 domain-containing kinase-binding protein 1 isoform X3 [Hippoglossus hippoglossus]XP_034998090.1 SH3 domain-containing kinase-binding protein 1 isoform X3 [Hippoglossus stenolepis]